MVGFLSVSVGFFLDRDVVVEKQFIGLRNTAGSIQCGRISGTAWESTSEVKLLTHASSEGPTINWLDIVLPEGLPAGVALCFVQAFNETIVGVTPLLVGEDFPGGQYSTVFLHGTVDPSEWVGI